METNNFYVAGGTLRPDAPPIAGDPKELLNDWMKRLALKFDERWKILPSQPVETTKPPDRER